MQSVDQLILDAGMLPLEEREKIIDSLLQTMHTDPNTDKKWMDVVRRRIEDYRSGKATMIPGSEVFENAQELFSQ